MVIALNMMDEMRANGSTVDILKLEQELGVPVVPISAAKNEGIDELIEHALRAAEHKELPKRQDFCTGAVHRCIHSLAHVVEDHAAAIGVPPRFAATKLVEGDKPMIQQLKLTENELELAEKIEHFLDRRTVENLARLMRELYPEEDCKSPPVLL